MDRVCKNCYHFSACNSFTNGKTLTADATKCRGFTSTENIVYVKHGRWKYTAASFNKCSVCGWEELLPQNFCPHCGAKMDGKESANNENL